MKTSHSLYACLVLAALVAPQLAFADPKLPSGMDRCYTKCMGQEQRDIEKCEKAKCGGRKQLPVPSKHHENEVPPPTPCESSCSANATSEVKECMSSCQKQ